MLKNVTVSLNAGRWQVTFCCEHERHVGTHQGSAVGADLGVSDTVTLSTGEHLSLPMERIHVLKRQRKRAQRVVARGRRGSHRNRRAKLRAAKISARIGRIRRHWPHETSKELSERFSVVVFEDLKIRNMTARLNEAILDQCWGELVRQTNDKLEERGGHAALVNSRGTSQACSSCGHRDPESRKSQAVFRCVACSDDLHADVNAARTILRRWSTPLPDVDGSCLKHPDEASTRQVAA